MAILCFCTDSYKIILMKWHFQWTFIFQIKTQKSSYYFLIKFSKNGKEKMSQKWLTCSFFWPAFILLGMVIHRMPLPSHRCWWNPSRPFYKPTHLHTSAQMTLRIHNCILSLTTSTQKLVEKKMPLNCKWINKNANSIQTVLVNLLATYRLVPCCQDILGCIGCPNNYICMYYSKSTNHILAML